MGHYRLKNGTMVEMIFDKDLGDFVRFGDDVTPEQESMARKEIAEWQAEFFGVDMEVSE